MHLAVAQDAEPLGTYKPVNILAGIALSGSRELKDWMKMMHVL